MSSKRVLFLLGISTVFLLTSCSGSKTVCTVNCGGGGGNANVTLTFSDTPPAGALFLNLNLPVSSISLTPSGGGADVNLLSTSMTYETTHLQSDSTLIGTTQVSAGTYTTLNVFVSNSPSSVWYNGSSGTLLGCNAGQVCNLSGGAPGKLSVDLTKVFSTSGLVLTKDENLGINLDFNLNKAITTTNGIELDLTQPNVFTATALPRTNQATGTLDTIQDFTGIVTAKTSSTLTVKSPSRGTQVFTVGSGTTYTEVSTPCSGGASLSCITVNSTVSVDADVSTTGTLTATVVDILDITAVDEVEGTVFPTTTAGVYGLVVSDTAVASGNPTLTGLGPGFAIYVTMSTSPIPLFTVDLKNLPASISAGFTNANDLIGGQEVRFRVASVGTFSGRTELIASTAILRYTRMTALVGSSTPTGSVFYLDNSSINPFYGTFLSQPQVQTYSPQTIIDGVSGVSSLTVGESVSISTLFLNPTQATPAFLATKVRKH
jgi:hypothetical protein